MITLLIPNTACATLFFKKGPTPMLKKSTTVEFGGGQKQKPKKCLELFLPKNKSEKNKDQKRKQKDLLKILWNI